MEGCPGCRVPETDTVVLENAAANYFRVLGLKSATGRLIGPRTSLLTYQMRWCFTYGQVILHSGLMLRKSATSAFSC